MRYLSVCSGIEAATVAWHGMGWTPLAFSEIEAFPRAVLAHHYPGVPLHGDFTALREQDWIVDADLLVGGTPCQAFSVAGLRQSLSDDRGNLTLEFVRLADAIDNARGGAGRPPAIIVWENVPGVLSTRDNAFGCYLGALAGEDCPLLPAGKRWSDAGMVVGPARTIAWRVLDAQYFGLAQRRRRVFVVASADPGFDPAEVLFEREGLRRDSAPSREAGQGLARNAPAGAGGGGAADGLIPEVAACLETTSHDYSRADGFTMIASLYESHPLDSRITGPVEQSPTVTARWGTGGNNTPLVSQPAEAVGFNWANGGGYGNANDGLGITIEGTGPLQRSQVPAVAFPSVTHTLRGEGFDASEDGTGKGTPLVPAAMQVQWASGGGQIENPTAQALRSNAEYNYQFMRLGMQVRRLTPVECERLQGFPDGYTAIPWRNKPADDCPDGPRYKALGNSMAVPVMRWIGARIKRCGSLS